MGQIFTFSGPRGVGKTTIVEDLRDRSGIHPIVPYSTREPRSDEMDGREYNFVSDYEFDTIRRTQGMFDVLTLQGTKYGTPVREFDRIVNSDNDGIESIATINLAAKSAIELRKEIGAGAVRSIFVLPTCWNDIEQQMRDNGIPETKIVERRSAEPTNLTLLPEFDNIIINAYGEREQTFRRVAEYITRITGVELTY